MQKLALPTDTLTSSSSELHLEALEVLLVLDLLDERHFDVYINRNCKISVAGIPWLWLVEYSVEVMVNVRL